MFEMSGKQTTQIGLHVGHGGLSKGFRVTARTAEGTIKLMTQQFSKRVRHESMINGFFKTSLNWCGYIHIKV